MDSIDNNDIQYKQDWAFADINNIELEQLKQISKLPFHKKLEWLEQAQELVNYINSHKKSNKINSSNDNTK